MYPIYLNSPSFIFISLIQSWPLSFTAAGTHADQWSQEIVIDSSYCHSSGVHAFCAERGDTGPRYKHCCKLCHIHLHTHTKSRALELCVPFIRTQKNLKKLTESKGNTKALYGLFTVYNLPYVYKSLNLTQVDKEKDTTTLYLPVNEVKCHFISHVTAELNKRLIIFAFP